MLAAHPKVGEVALIGVPDTRWEYSVVAALPRNPSGKVLETALRREHSAGSLVAEPVV